MFGVSRDEISLIPELRAGRARQGEQWTVSEVNTAARELVEGVFPPLWITGEVTNFTRARSGHCYFTLRDESSQLRCVMWRDDAARLPTLPTEGMAVRVFGRLTVYLARGEFQLTVSTLEGEGEGLWKLALDRLRQKLEAEGLTAPHRKRPIPRHPEVIGVVTSPGGAVFHDIVNIVRRRAPWTRVVLVGCRVQGEGAAAEIAMAIRRVVDAGIADVLIVGRGGGSVEDLWAFNEEAVARAIAECPIPVISAVGHETDITIADLVADLRAPTPSAAAEAAVPDRVELARTLARDEWRLRAAIATRLVRAVEKARDAGTSLARSGENLLATRRTELRTAVRQLEALSPLAAFSRGYAVPLREGRILRHREEFTPGLNFDLRVGGGVVPCTVDALSPAADSGSAADTGKPAPAASRRKRGSKGLSDG
ncbi:MAG: exodeoxyribonuclease VII large subunit [Gemmatimonadota bacterium]|jgi:exodeoxyribonuclease VII large subunit|nr:exodeoxyribonuclease VII large subunit [Gemmatimonadota bacterium]